MPNDAWNGALVGARVSPRVLRPQPAQAGQMPFLRLGMAKVGAPPNVDPGVEVSGVQNFAVSEPRRK
eukprot:13629989-Alexandrium_andersonii.AAC.1